jgi:hypothetical protein
MPRKFTEEQRREASVISRKMWKNRTKYGQNAIGKRFGTLTVIAAPTAGSPNYKTKCDCGKISQRVYIQNLAKIKNPTCLRCLKKRALEREVGQKAGGTRLLKRYPSGEVLILCLVCGKREVYHNRTWDYHKKKIEYGCRTCVLTRKRELGQTGKKISINGVSKNLAAIDKVTAEDIQRLAKEIFKTETLNLAIIGPYENIDNLKPLLEIK